MKSKRKDKAMTTASITVEAAFIMPIIILTIFALIYLAFYLHDKSRIQGVIDLTLHKASMTLKHEADLSNGQVKYESIRDRGVLFLLLGDLQDEEEQLEDYVKKELSNGLFYAQIKTVDAKINKFKLTISVGMDMDINLPGINNLFQSLSGSIIKEEQAIHNPAESIRLMEVVLETGSDIKGVDQLKEKLNKFLTSSK